MEHFEARAITRALPRGGHLAPPSARLVVRKVGRAWRLEAPLEGEVFPLARWLCDEPILQGLEDGACLAIEPRAGGGFELRFQGSRASVDRFLEWIRPDAEETRVRRLAPVDGEAPSLTEPQDDALRRGVALGYYRIPRAIHLSELAAKLDVSPAALSERLRRAEARLVLHYVTQATEADDAAED